MSFNYYLYRAPEGLPAMNMWEEDHAEPLGSLQDVSERLSRLYPSLRWDREKSSCWSALGPNGDDDPYLDVMLLETEPDLLQYVIFNKAAPSTLRQVMDDLGLNYCCAPEAAELVDPYSVDDDWNPR